MKYIWREGGREGRKEGERERERQSQRHSKTKKRQENKGTKIQREYIFKKNRSDLT